MSLKIAAAYIRVSTDDQTELSPDSQIKKIREYAKTHGYVIPHDQIYRDEGKSGRTTKKRDSFNRMIAAAQNNPKPFSAILVWKFSRFARNREDSIVLKSMLKKNGIDVISISETVGDDKMSILVEALIEAMDEYYSINLSEEVLRGMMEKFSRGQAISAPPFGYKMINGQYVIDEEAKPYVLKIFSEYMNGKSCREIAQWLNAKGIRTKRGNKFENRTVYYIIHNPVYAGYIRWDVDGRGARSHYRDGKEMIVRSSHEPYVDEKTYTILKAMFDAEKKNAKKYERKSPIINDFILRGLVRCSNCGATLCMAASGKSLQCYKYAHGKCTISHSISVNLINKALISALKEDVKSTELRIIPSNKTIDISLDYDGRIKKEKEKLSRIKAAFQSGIDTLEEYRECKQKISDTINQLEKEKAEHLEQLPKSSQDDLQNKIITTHLFSNSSIPERKKNAVLKTFIDKIIFDRKSNEITIFYFL